MQTKAIILRKQPSREYDQLVTCYSQELGKFTAVAKSSLKMGSIQGRHLDTLNLVDFDLINGRATSIIAGAHCERSFRTIKTSLPHLAAASFFLEVVNRIAYDHQADEKLWAFLINTLNDLEQLSEHELLSLFRQKQRDFLIVLGYGSQLAAVVDNANELDGYFEYTFGVRLSSLPFLYHVI